jgi:hypothetical protein
MATPLIPQEIFLLERYTSAGYFGQLRDTWAEMVAHLERCLDEFMRNLPLDYRDHPLPEQPDAVWGERVIPNFRDTLQSLNDGYAKLSGGDISGLEFCHGPLNDFKGQTDFWSGWMVRKDENIYGELLNKAVRMAGNIRSTEGAYWNPMTLSSRYDEQSRGALDAPPSWPTYKLASAGPVNSGDPLPVSGIYLPEIDNSCAEFLSTEYETVPAARVYAGDKDLVDPDTGVKYGQQAIFTEQPCRWRLVERMSDAGTSSAPSLLDHALTRVPGGAPCPRSGVYFTPAKENSRRRFSKGEIMPAFDSTYGATIWQWDLTQE